MNRPNILYLHSHDTGRFVQPYGHAVHTPRLQRLAEEGVLFRQAFCAAPTCSASRSCLLTGQHAHSNGMLGLAHRGFSLYDYGHHLVNTLKTAGYTSALAGIQHIANMFDEPWRAIGYDRYLGDPGAAGEEACRFLDDAPDQPFFLSVGFAETHREFPERHPGDDPAYCMPPAPLPDTPDTREDMARFKASARILDEKMGRVLDALDRNGLAENTLVICTTDHGIAFPRMKCNLTDGGIGVMLIVRGPGGFEGGKACDALVSQVDIFPTVCELLGIDRPDWLQGVSLMPLIRGEAAEVRDELFAEVSYHASYEPQRGVRTQRWKFIRRFDDRTRPVLPNCDDSPSKDVWIEGGWADAPPPAEALYDLLFDPSETNNLVNAPHAQAALADLRARLDTWMRDTDDPLLEGPVPAPEGAIVNDPDGLSPSEKNFV
ncbi:MAG: sulfatase-like hydrolase/transferase [Nitrospiraceae bacterium]|nr:sulfatase-like hydrolase/transferase [Nitrospiraceae bacterium]